MELTKEQIATIEDFFFFTDAEGAISELNDMFRSHLRNPELFCDKKKNVTLKLADNHFMVEKISTLIRSLSVNQ